MSSTPEAKIGFESVENTEIAEPIYVVGIGASAGGLEALEQFFDNMPANTGMGFVVVQHLSPDFKSMMNELLARRTTMPIVRVEDGCAIQPNHVYLMPPRKEMILIGGRLLLTDKDPSQGFALPIDRFMRSLAQDLGHRSVAVILSGTGSDGSRGIRDVHAAGGLVVVQSEESAKFDGMPRSARETGMVDVVASAADLPEAILNLVRLSGTGSDSTPAHVPALGLHDVFRMLRDEYGIDFSQYKPGTVARRIERRLWLNQALNIEEYVNRLTENGTELNQLYKDLLIGVTQFFRDCEAFHKLGNEELPKLLARVSDDQEFRVWVAGCATGEEAYSLAILIDEQLEALGRRPTVRIFATDAHRASLEIAGAGIYKEDTLAAVSSQRRERYFLPRGDAYQVIPALRKMIVFAPHDLLKDAPFTRLDLITCRNLLIYFQPAAQKKILSLFHFGLNTGGLLFLGPSESPGELSDEFDAVDEHWKMYHKRRDVRLRPEMRLLAPLDQPTRMRGVPGPSASLPSDRLQQAIYNRLLEEQMPTSFLINDRRELIHSFGGAGKYLRMRDGRATTNLLDMVDPELKMILLGALARAEKELLPVTFTGIRLATEAEGERLVRLTVKPMNDRAIGLTCFLISFEDVGRPAAPRDETAIDLGEASREHVRALEQDLRYTRENLQAMIEEQESSNEELQATNEELVASNEELQSTNEELHSVNEELYTVNAEYQHKIQELTQVTADLENLFLATDVGIVFLDRELRIRRITPGVARLFNLVPRDVGRPISGFSSLINAPVMDLLRQTLESGQPCEQEAQDQEGNCYFLRILPYRVAADTVDGIVLSLIDISALKKAEARYQHLSAIVESSGDAIIGNDLDGNIVSWNHGAELMFGYAAAEIVGQHARRLILSAVEEEEFNQVMQLIRTGQSVTEERRRVRRDGTVIDILHTVSPIRDPSGRISGASGVSRDITARKQAEREIRASVRNRDQFLAMLSHELRNPLGAILNASQVLERVPVVDERAAAACRVIHRQTRQMGNLLDDLLDVVRVTQNKIILRRQRCTLAEVLREAVETVEPLIAEQRQELDVLGLESPLEVAGDSGRLQQVAINLLKNASKYSPAGGRITLQLAEEQGHAVIRVRDTGVGIAADMLPRVFDMFVQSTATLDRADGGLGVGLTLVKAIVELHGGTVSVTSEGPGTGSEFTVRLPLEPLLVENSAPAGPLRGSQPSRHLKIAIIEDNPDSRAMLQELLTLDGHRVHTAADGQAGIELLTRERPDVALVDIGLPVLDGFEVARRLRESQSNRSTVLVAVTGYGFPADREKVLSSGFDAHLVKPLQFPELTALLARV